MVPGDPTHWAGGETEDGTIYGDVRSCKVMYCHVCSCTVMSGHVWSCIGMYRNVS